MISLKAIIAIALAYATASLAAVVPLPLPQEYTHSHAKHVNCGEISLFLTGLPYNHPLVAAQHFDPAVVESLMRHDQAAVIQAGFNIKMVMFGPEEDTNKVLAEHMPGVDWAATGVGYGVRGGDLDNLTTQFEDTIQFFRDAVGGPIIFNGPVGSMLPAINRHFQTRTDCRKAFAGSGKDLVRNALCTLS
ncbi:hypothetical protein QBC35DRAFT_555747 [Podospora australis]|uniref:Uncharacterized protein n=1 Tax=Podospora australis TaxID=1536484 RepID=A0AAN7AFZ5_9PEZI|nr:hypothetical protein QBC35DRAFT_555747 [Podospora australis]